MTEKPIATYYVDGRFTTADQAVIPVDDLAVLRGLGVCDLMRTFNRVPYFLREHVERLIDSAGKIGLNHLPWSTRELERIISDTLYRNPNVEDANIRVIITGGSSDDFMTPRGRPRLIVMVTQIPAIPETWYTRGVKVITTPSERAIPGAKSISYISATLAMKKARQEGAVEALLVDREGHVPEGTTSNLFAFKDGTLITAEEGILAGITRSVILKLASPLFPVSFRTLDQSELPHVDEVFISGTNKGIVPVVRIDAHRIGDGRPGPGTRSIIQALKAHQERFQAETEKDR